MKLLIKFPTRGRPEKALETLKKYIDHCANPDLLRIIVSIDDDDATVNKKMFEIHPCVTVISGPPLGKVGAINRDMPDPSTFDIVVLASDDMVPVFRDYDNVIRSRMKYTFPDNDGVLWFNDGYAKFKLNTLIICGSPYYKRFGYLYHPDYKSLFCDNEFMDEANRLGRQIYFDKVIIKHEHPANSTHIKSDEIYDHNEKFWDEDKKTYERRKFKDYDVSVLICTIPERYSLLFTLVNKINTMKQSSRLNIEVLYDNRTNISVGEKRNDLLSRCLGTYSCFVDDDDDIGDDYFKVIEDSELKYDCITLNGMMYTDGSPTKPFTHSLKYDHWFEDDAGYYRNPNHLNPIKTEIARAIGFPKIGYGEDRVFSENLLKSGLVKTEYIHNILQYKYMYKTVKPNRYPVVRLSNIFGRR